AERASDETALLGRPGSTWASVTMPGVPPTCGWGRARAPFPSLALQPWGASSRSSLEEDLVDGHAGLAPDLIEADRLRGDVVAVPVEVEGAHDPVVDAGREHLLGDVGARPVRLRDRVQHDLGTLCLVDRIRRRELTSLEPEVLGEGGEECLPR